MVPTDILHLLGTIFLLGTWKIYYFISSEVFVTVDNKFKLEEMHMRKF